MIGVNTLVASVLLVSAWLLYAASLIIVCRRVFDRIDFAHPKLVISISLILGSTMVLAGVLQSINGVRVFLFSAGLSTLVVFAFTMRFAISDVLYKR